MSTEPPKPRTIELTVDIDTTLEEAWKALTTGEGIARWFAPYAAVEPGEHGSVSIGWDPKEMWSQPITVWEPLRRMQTASDMPRPDGRVVRLAVDYFLEAREGGGVRVRLVHSGFDDSESWDSYIDGLEAGWGFFMFNLKHAFERHRGIDRVQLSARFRTAEVAARSTLSSAAMACRSLRPRAALRAGDRCSLTIGGEPVNATVALRHPPRTIAFVVPAWNDALLFVEREGLKNPHTLGVWLSLYGVDNETAGRLRSGLETLRAALNVPEQPTTN
jgi:uncharacterized protein YndB with AHSA1/START domain